MSEAEEIKPNDPEFQEWLKGILRQGVVTVVFTKKNGDERVMNCTLNEELLPKVYKEATEVSEVRQTSNTSLAVFDVEAQGWRAFKWESVKQVGLTIGE